MAAAQTSVPDGSASALSTPGVYACPHRQQENLMPYVSHRDQRIHYTVDGSGPLLILQHGFLSNGSRRYGK